MDKTKLIKDIQASAYIIQRRRQCEIYYDFGGIVYVGLGSSNEQSADLNALKAKRRAVADIRRQIEEARSNDDQD